MLDVERLVRYFSQFQLYSEKELREAAEFTNIHFPDAKGFTDDSMPPDWVLFRSERSAYAIRFGTLEVKYLRKFSEAQNPKYWYDGFFRIDLNTLLTPNHIVYRRSKKKQNQESNDDWRKKAADNKKDRQDNVDELLAATKLVSGGFDFGAGSNSSSTVDDTSDNASLSEPESPESKSDESRSARIEEDLKLVNENLPSSKDLEKIDRPSKSKPKKAVKKSQMKSNTKGIW